MSEIEKYKKYLNFKANPRYLTRDFIVPLYTGTEPDILDDSDTQRESSVYKEFPNDMPIISPKRIQNQPYEQLELFKKLTSCYGPVSKINCDLFNGHHFSRHYSFDFGRRAGQAIGHLRKNGSPSKGSLTPRF